MGPETAKSAATVETEITEADVIGFLSHHVLLGGVQRRTLAAL